MPTPNPVIDPGASKRFQYETANALRTIHYYHEDLQRGFLRLDQFIAAVNEVNADLDGILWGGRR